MKGTNKAERKTWKKREWRGLKANRENHCQMRKEKKKKEIAIGF